MKLLILAILFVFNFNPKSFGAIKNFELYSVTSNKLVNIQFEKHDLNYVFIFLSKDCPCSKGNLEYINELSKKYPDVRFVGIHAKKKTKVEEVQNYLKDKKINFEILNDPDLLAANLFKALKTPHAFIVNKMGEIIYSGGVTNSIFPEHAKEFYLKNALEDLANIAKNETKTLGCFIERS
jgi:thiol-disulfide isomerase/thioredoxin